MPLQLKQYQHEGITVLQIAKQLQGEPDSAYLLVIIDQLIASEKIEVLLNLRELTSIDSLGITTLTEVHARVTKAGGTIKLVNATERQTDLLILSQLAPIFPNFNDEDAALRSFASTSESEVKRFDILEFVREVNEEEKQQPETNAKRTE